MKKVSRVTTEVIQWSSLQSLLYQLGVTSLFGSDRASELLVIKKGRVVKSIELVGKSITYLVQFDESAERSSKDKIDELSKFLKSQSVTMKVTYTSDKIVGPKISTKFKFYDLFKFNKFESISLTVAQLIDIVDYKYYQIDSIKLLKLFKVALLSRNQVIKLTNLNTDRFFVTRTNQSLFEALNRKGLVYNRLVTVPSIGAIDEFMGVNPSELLIEILDPEVPESYYKRSGDVVKSSMCTNSK